jgi:hypothetical protein
VSSYNDVWVTAYGFSPADVSLVLKALASCGDILAWGTYGVPAANFVHVQVSDTCQMRVTRMHCVP